MVTPSDSFPIFEQSDIRTGPQRVFAGRVIFDHLPKTAGMAINHWLRTVLGSGCASPTIVCDHRSLIARYGGAYSVLTAHIKFDSPGLDPRYRYATLFREPIDRLVSWLYFVVSNHRDADLGDIWHAAKRFLEDEHAEVDGLPLANPCVQHFAAIIGGPLDSDDQLLAAALVAVERYDVWGLYESMPEFLADFASLLGVGAPPTLDRVNVTRQRPTMADLPPLNEATRGARIRVWSQPKEGDRCHEERSSQRSRSSGSCVRPRSSWPEVRPCLRWCGSLG